MQKLAGILVIAALLGLGERAFSQPSPYVVDGLALGARVHFKSHSYKQYKCGPSENFLGFTWCHKQETERTRHGEVTSSNSILHSQDGTAVYVNRYITPAFLAPNDVQAEIDRLSAKFDESPRLYRMPSREGLPNAIIAVWGKIKLERLDAAEVSFLAASGKSPKGLSVSFLGDLQRSAKAGVPVYRLTGGAGFLWAATFDRYGKGVLRFLTIDASQIEPAIAQNEQASTPSGNEGVRNMGWSIEHFTTDTSNGCFASKRFDEGTTIRLILVDDAEGRDWGILLYNPIWRDWVASQPKHLLYLQTKDAGGQATFSTLKDNDSLILTDVKVDFMNSIADADSLVIFDDNKSLITSLEMTGSRAAIQDVVNCKDQNLYTSKAPSATEPQKQPQTSPEAISGTAFFVSHNLLLTNYHVVGECKDISVRYPDTAWFPATLTGTDETNDLALLHTNMDGISVASFHFGPRLGEQVAAYGFPYVEILSSSGNFTVGNVTSLSGLRDDTRFLQMSTPIQPGNSGGPLLDMSGNVVGIVDAQLDALAVMKADKSLPQNVNFAIKAPIVANFLAVKGVAVTPKTDTAINPTLQPSDVAGVAQKFTVQIYCSGTSSRTARK